MHDVNLWTTLFGRIILNMGRDFIMALGWGLEGRSNYLWPTKGSPHAAKVCIKQKMLQSALLKY